MRQDGIVHTPIPLAASRHGADASPPMRAVLAQLGGVMLGCLRSGLRIVSALVGCAGLAAGCGTPTGGDQSREEFAAVGGEIATSLLGTPPTSSLLVVGDVATRASIPADEGPIVAGTYRIPKSAWSVADFTMTMPAGWTVQYGHDYLKYSDAPNELGFYAVVVDDIYNDACEHGEVLAQVGASVDALAVALLRQEGPSASGPVKTTLGDHPAIRVDLSVPQDLDVGSCRLQGAGLQIWYSVAADKYFVLLPDGMASVYILDVDGRRQVFLTQHRSAASDEDVAELRRILESIRIGSDRPAPVEPP